MNSTEFDVLQTVEDVWNGIDTNIVSLIPYIHKNPFVCALWNNPECPDFQTEGFPFWTYCLTLALMGPTLFLINALPISILSGEWGKRAKRNDFFKHEILMTSTVLFMTSPFLAINYKLLFESKMGRIFYNFNEASWLYNFASFFLFNIACDTWFYWVHRLFHEIEFLYTHSHYLHHSKRPVNTFMGNAGDMLELITQGELQVFMAPIFVPMHLRVFVLTTIFNQWYTCFLHCDAKLKVPVDFIIDGYDHNIHHYYGFKNYNFGLYTKFWDRLMGTYRAEPTAGKSSTFHKLSGGSKKKNDDAGEKEEQQYEGLKELLGLCFINCVKCWWWF